MSEEPKKRREMSTSARQAAFCALYSHAKDGGAVLERGILKKTAELFSVDDSTMGRLWRDIHKKAADQSLAVTDILDDPSFFQSKSRNRGRPPKWDRQQLRDALNTVPQQQRKSLQKMANAAKIPKSTLHDMFKKGF